MTDTYVSALSPVPPSATVEFVALDKALKKCAAYDRMMLTKEERVKLENEFQWETSTLLKNLVEHIKGNAIPPISSFYVGVAGLGESGNVYFGCNMEFTGERIGATIHGEQCMLANAAYRGEKAITMFAVNAAPCGHCRQFLNELPGASNIRVLITNPQVDKKMSAILPYAFGPSDLGATDRFLDTLDNNLEISSSSADDSISANNNPKAVKAALDAANRSYSPYTNSPAGISLVARRGKSIRKKVELDQSESTEQGRDESEGREEIIICPGFYVENAAYNPSLPPMQAALVALRACGVRDFASIQEAVLVEKRGAPVHHLQSSIELLKTIAPGAKIIHLFADVKKNRKRKADGETCTK